jgi:hypothetical protein
MEPDILTRAIAIAALAIALGNIVVTWWLWTRSGPRIKVGLKREDHPNDRLKDRLVVKVSNTGRMPVLVKEVGIEDRVATGSAGSSPESYLTLPLAPSDGGPIPRVISHTDLPLVAEAEMPQIIDRWAAGRKLTLVAWAKDGNDRKRTSREITVTTPRWPV